MNIEASYNFRRISARLTTSGIVQTDGLRALGSQGYEVLVNLLPDSSEHAVPNERSIVESQDIEYIHIPVDFKQPAAGDFATFSEVMDRIRERRVHVHCAANYRVSAFYSLYAISRGLWSRDEAMNFISGIWQPTEHPGWSEFVTGVLADVGPKELQQKVGSQARRDGA